MSKLKPHRDLAPLATGINHALATMNGGHELEFMLVVVTQSDDKDGTVSINTITGILEPNKIRLIGQQLIDMASIQEPCDPIEDTEVQGHA